MNGVLVVNKPPNWTSHDVVARVRNVLRAKVGHTGTLDPQATGVLPLMIGSATRLMRFMVEHDKVYVAQVRLGTETDTYDAQGEVVAEHEAPALLPAEAHALLKSFLGPQEQVPPMFSAIRIDGERLYKAARRGEVKERPARPIEIFNIEVIEVKEDLLTLSVHCSGGTYIRSLAHDLGKLVGCGAHLVGLVRERSGVFCLDQAVSLDSAPEEWLRALIPVESLLTDFPRIDVPPQSSHLLRNGNPVPVANRSHGELVRLFLEDQLFAIGEVRGQHAQPRVVLGKTP